MASGTVKLRAAPIIDYSRLLWNRTVTNTSYTATEPCYFHTQYIAYTQTTGAMIYVNGNPAGIEDASNGYHVMSASGFLSPGDVLTGVGMTKVFALK